MSFEKPLTIREAVDSVDKKKYLLPAIQREFVWSTNQIEKLFDSLMREYPIGMFLFWHVERARISNFQFYEFIRNYHEKDQTHNPKANISGIDDIVAILDGQQRLTALYIGLKGTYSYKLPRKRWDSSDAFPKRKLYINLLASAEDTDMEYDFKFLTEGEARIRSESQYWFMVGEILNMKEKYEVNEYLIEKGLSSLDDKEKAKFANKTLFRLHNIIHERECINLYLEKGEQLDKVLNIFIRVNSGGTQLSYSDLLLSIATAQWKDKDAREEITSFLNIINNIGEGFVFDKDFVLKSCLVLSDISEIAFKVDNFNKENMYKIESKWDAIAKSLNIAIELVSSWGYNYQNLTSANAIIPVAYYLQKKGNPENFILSQVYKDDREKIKKWFMASLLKRAFSGQPDNILRPIRSIIQEKFDNFPIDDIYSKFKGTNKALIFTDDDIENLLYSKYGQPHTFSVLLALYPTLDLRNRFHQDHIFPKSLFKGSILKKKGIESEYHELFLDNCNCIGNLQLLEGLPNQEKQDKDFKKWVEATFLDTLEKEEYFKKHFIPKNISLELEDFVDFFEKRNKLISDMLKNILS